MDICNSVIQTNNQPIYSPGYGSSNYSNDAECVTTIVSPSCVELQFNFIDLFDDSCDDVITVSQIGNCCTTSAERILSVFCDKTFKYFGFRYVQLIFVRCFLSPFTAFSVFHPFLMPVTCVIFSEPFVPNGNITYKRQYIFAVSCN